MINKIDFTQVTEEHYNVDLTFKCNWNCFYCCADTHHQSFEITKELVMTQISRVPDDSTVSFAGGEPGLVAYDDLVEYCEALKDKNCVITVDTNGTFLENYPCLVKKYISDILYHCQEDISIRNPIKEYSFDHIPLNFNFVYQLIFTSENNMDDLEYYFNKYPHITFSVVGNDKATINGKVYQSLPKSKGFDIYRKFKDRLFLPHVPLLFLSSDNHENCISVR